ncbi:MAG: tetratricopeptide repeat protein, partial [Terriglobales bacterium]
MRVAFKQFAAYATATIVASGLVLAEGDQDLAACKGESEPYRQIAGCTAVIQSGFYHGQDLASAYFGRAIAYARTKNIDHAIEDFDAGLAVDPTNAAALYNRALAYE